MTLSSAIPPLIFLFIVACSQGCSSSLPEETPTPDITGTPIFDNDGDGWSAAGGDCNDNIHEVCPDCEEKCDGHDNDCDGVVDEDTDDSGQVLYPDDDGDSYGRTSDAIQICVRDIPPGLALYPDDCDDTNPNVYPYSPELCGDGLDNDCDGSIDTVKQTAFLDKDLDGFGGAFVGKDCPVGATYSFVSGDCNDTNPAVHPDAGEDCHDELDNNCDGYIGSCGLMGYAFLEAGYAVVEQMTDRNALFGWDVSLKGDVDLDGRNELVIASPGTAGGWEDPDLVSFPATYWFGELPPGDWMHTDASIVWAEDSSAGEYVGYNMVSHLDFNGDAFPDLALEVDLVGVAGYPESTGGVNLYFYPFTGGDFRTADASVTASKLMTADFGREMCAGEFNGDDIGDLVITDPGEGNSYLYFGPFLGDRTAGDYDAVYRIPDQGDSFPRQVKCDGDLDGDGLDDLVILDPGWNGYRGRALLFFQLHAGDFDPEDVDAGIAGVSPDNFVGMGAAMDGDVNGDGFDDLLVDIGGDVAELGTTIPTAALFYMPLQGIHTILENDWMVDAYGSTGAGTLDGDINGDGLDDVVVNNGAAMLNGLGSAGIFYAPLVPGPHSYLEADAFVTSLEGAFLEQSFSGGDIDGDGYDDLVIRTEGADQLSRVYILQGGPVELKR